MPARVHSIIDDGFGSDLLVDLLPVVVLHLHILHKWIGVDVDIHVFVHLLRYPLRDQVGEYDLLGVLHLPPELLQVLAEVLHDALARELGLSHDLLYPLQVAQRSYEGARPTAALVAALLLLHEVVRDAPSLALMLHFIALYRLVVTEFTATVPAVLASLDGVLDCIED